MFKYKTLSSPVVAVSVIAASLMTLSQSVQASNSVDYRTALPIATKFKAKKQNMVPTQVKVGPNIYKLNVEVIQNRMPSIGSPRQNPSYAIVSLVPIKGEISKNLQFERLLLVDGNRSSASTTYDPVVQSAQQTSTVFRGFPSLPSSVDVILQFRSRSTVYSIRADRVNVQSVY